MKPPALIPLFAIAALLSTACDKPSSDLARQLAELERKTQQAVARQQELERQLEERKLAAERDAIERERMQIEEARFELERQQGEDAAAKAEELRLREETLASREGQLETLQSAIEEREVELDQRDQQLTGRELEIAGTEALDFPDEGEPQTPVADFGMFHNSLSSYGSWFDTPDYGYVWQPAIVRDTSWRPYTRGRWACSDHGWTWLSDEPFGWATYHYGRWALLRRHGWIWVPGCEWAPSWVSWRSNKTHIGWAPLPPETLAFRGRRWDSKVDVTFAIGAPWFNFVETRHFGGPIHRHCLPFSQNPVFIQQTINITNIHMHKNRVICGGPNYGDLIRQIGHRLPFYRLEIDRHGRPLHDPLTLRPRIHGDRLTVSAPDLDVPWNEGLKPNRIKGRLESITAERTEALRPEIADRFRQDREEGRNKADRAITELGGHGNFNPRRLELLETNRHQIEESVETIAKTPGTRKGPATGNVTNGPDRNTAKPAQTPQATREEPARLSPEHPRPQEQAGKRAEQAQVTPPKVDPRQRQEDAARQHKQAEEQAAQTRQRQALEEQAEQARQRQALEEQAEQAQQRKLLDDQAEQERQRQQEAAQLQQARQQHEQARQQQEETHLEQARQQEARTQQERARQQQDDEEKKRGRNR